MAKRTVAYQLDKTDKRILSDLDKVAAERKKLEARERQILRRAKAAELPIRLVASHLPHLAHATVGRRFKEL